MENSHKRSKNFQRSGKFIKTPKDQTNFLKSRNFPKNQTNSQKIHKNAPRNQKTSIFPHFPLHRSLNAKESEDFRVRIVYSTKKQFVCFGFRAHFFNVEFLGRNSTFGGHLFLLTLCGK
jgi:hypothetical protein